MTTTMAGYGPAPLLMGWLRRLHVDIVMLPLFVGLLITDVALQPDILTKAQIALTIQTALPLVLISIGEGIVLLSGGIDVSVGGSMVIANVLVATWGGSGAAQSWHILVIALIGVACGAFNGCAIVFGKLHPFVATLASWAIYDGIALQLLPSAGGSTPSGLTNWAQNFNATLPTPIIVLVVTMAFLWYWRSTRTYKCIYSVGSDEGRAGLSGVRTGQTKFIVYALAGLLAALAGIYLALTTASGDATSGDGYILPAIEACVLGGISLNGGSGGLGLAVAGAFIVTFVEGITSALSLPSWVSFVLSAGLLIVVIGVRSLLQRKPQQT